MTRKTLEERPGGLAIDLRTRQSTVLTFAPLSCFTEILIGLCFVSSHVFCIEMLPRSPANLSHMS